MLLVIALLLINSDVYLLPNDAVEIRIWRQEDLSGLYYVEADTTLNIPLIGKFSVSNIATDSLRAMLINNFKDYYTDVYVNVNFHYRINIFGEVKSPGYYYVKSEDNLANLLAQARGPTEKGSLGSIRILNLGRERIVDFEKILKKGENLEELKLQPGDVVIVPRRFMPIFQEWSVLFSLGTLILQIYIAAK
jgi:protein involved in polysaccharide export with SLBB domain